MMGVSANSRTYAEFLVVIGLVHHSIPLAALLITATIQNINPRLVEAAQALGAPLWRAQLSITVPLSMPGILSAFLVWDLIAALFSRGVLRSPWYRTPSGPSARVAVVPAGKGSGVSARSSVSRLTDPRTANARVPAHGCATACCARSARSRV